MVTADALVSTLALTVPLGVLGAVAMDLPMATLDEGLTPAYAAAATLRGTVPDAVSPAGAWAIHHLAGVAAGVLYGLVVVVLRPVVGGSVAAGALAAVDRLGGRVRRRRLRRLLAGRVAPDPERTRATRDHPPLFDDRSNR